MNLPDLPIRTLENDVCRLLPHRHLVIAAETGSGKSTLLPLWAAKHGRVLVIEPRRVACLALADYVAELSESTLGERVGYAVRLEQCYQADTEILFVTPGIALRWLAEDGLAGFDLVLLDEFHERRWDTDLLLAILKARAAHRLIITSATLSAQSLAAYLNTESLTAKGRNHEVAVRYKAAEPHYMPSLQGLEKATRNAVSEVLNDTDGDVLVFLPGKAELNSCQAALKDLDVELLQLHGGVSAQVQQKVLHQGDRRRVILATNVAETSLTLPAITAVVDSGLERRTLQRNGRTVLSLAPISKASAEQRKGRAGRLVDGICVRLWGAHAPLEVHTPGQVKREALSELVMAAACADMPVTQLEFIEALPEKSLNQALERLHQIDAIDHQGVATETGRALFPLPVDSFFAHLISVMPDDRCKAAMVDLSAMLSLGVRVGLPKDEQGIKELQQWQPISCDFLTRVMLLRGDVPGFIKVDEQSLHEARRLATQMREQLALPGIGSSTMPDRNTLVEALLKGSPSLAFVRRIKRTDAMGNGEMEVIVGDHSRMPDQAMAALVLDDHSIPGKRGTRQTITVATCLMPVTFSQLVEAGIGEVEVGAPKWEEGNLTVSREVHFAGRVLVQQQAEATGNDACKAMAQLILKGTLFPEVGSKLLDDIVAWQLYATLGLAEVPPTDTAIEAEQWLVERLSTLGIETGSDLELIDSCDLHFDGIPEWQRAHFDEKYPRVLSLGDLKLAVHYDVRRKVVTVEKLAGLRKKDPARWELPGWSGWKVRYRQASRVVDVR